MAIITIPTKINRAGDLVAIPRKDYEEFLRLRKFIPTIRRTPSQKRDLEQARKEYRKGEYITLQQLEHELGGARKKKG